MIGFSTDLSSEMPRPEEGLETRDKQKIDLYRFVSSNYVLPTINSKGVTRDYLLGVHNGTFFRVTCPELKRFEFDLTEKQTKRVGVLNNGFIVKKLNLFLANQQKCPLGFSEFDPPEQNWLFRIARFIDKHNVLELFEDAVIAPDRGLQNSSHLYRVHFGRIAASKYLFREAKFRSSKQLWEQLKLLSEAYRTRCSLYITQEALALEAKKVREKCASQDQLLNDVLGKVSITYTALEDPAITPEIILSSSQRLSEQQRGSLTNNNRL